MIKTLLKITAILAIMVVATFLFLVYFSVEETAFKCTGDFDDNKEAHTEIFIRLEEYRWWVEIWNSSKGNLWLEIPNKAVHYYPQISLAGDQLQIWEYEEKFAGVFSKLSLVIGLNTPHGVFEGKCEKIKE